jgi:hypothetical protein
VVDKINEFNLTLKDKIKSVEDRRFALRFLIHCVEDLHQPCHVGDNNDKGGNQTQVRFYGKGTNMHALWDSGMIERVSKSEDRWLAELGQLDTPDARQEAIKGTVEDWATEPLLAARQAYQVPETGKRLKPAPHRLSRIRPGGRRGTPTRTKILRTVIGLIGRDSAIARAVSPA